MSARTGTGEPPRTLGARLRFLLTPRWIALIVGAIAFALACYLILAPWQFGRNSERSARNHEIASAIAAAPVPIDRLMSTTSQPGPAAIWHAVTVTGTFDTSREAYIRLRQDNDGNPASEVVVPLVTAGGTSVLVDRGYVSFTSVQQKAALPALPTGTVTVTGRVQADQTDPKHRPAVPAPDGRMQYTAASSVLAGPGPVYRGFLQLTDDSPGVIDAIGLPQQDSGPFFSYALQWLSFGAIAVLGIGYFIYREFSDPAEEDIYLPDGADPGPDDRGPDGADRGLDAADRRPDSADPGSDDRETWGRSSRTPARAARVPAGGPAAQDVTPQGGAVPAGTVPVGARVPADPQASLDGAARSDGRLADRDGGGASVPGQPMPADPLDKSAAQRPLPGTRGKPSPRRPRRSRGFDKSQLYDS